MCMNAYLNVLARGTAILVKGRPEVREIRFPRGPNPLTRTGFPERREGADVVEDVIRRCHLNSVESYRAFARSISGARHRERDSLFLCDTGDPNPLGNVAWVVRPPSNADATISEVRDFFAASGVRWILLALPEVADALAGAARRAGLVREGVFPGMLLDPIPLRMVEGSSPLEVRPVRTEEELHAFDVGEARAYGVSQFPPEPRLLKVENITMFVGFLDGAPVSVAALVRSHGIAGIVAVGTVPEARGRGFARRVVGRAVEVGRELGCGQSFLWATERGRHVYAKMGFRKVLDYPVWTLPEFPLPPEDYPVRESTGRP
jgi:GNAT superfamily N-acetyltransferase